MDDLLKNYDYYLFKIQATNITNFLLKKVFIKSGIINVYDVPAYFCLAKVNRHLRKAKKYYEIKKTGGLMIKNSIF